MNTNNTSPIDDLQVTLERAGRRCTVFGSELVDVLGSPGVVLRLAAILYARSRTPIGLEGTTGMSNATPEQIASYLADKLEDAKSLAFFRRVAEVVPAVTIREALVTALDLRPSEIRRSRAAYFTSLIMPHLRRCGPKP
jgi:hypothetical protein